MKTLAIFLVTVSVATALTISPQLTAGIPGQAAAPTPGAAAGPGAAGGATGPGFVDYGPKVYGLGAKNPMAFPPNPFSIQRAVHVANTYPNVLVRLDMNGEITLTNQYGQEVEVVDAFGREIEIE